MTEIPSSAAAWCKPRETRSLRRSRRRVRNIVYWGLASRPFVLEGTTERRRVVAVPRLRIEPAVLEGAWAHDAARAWIESTSFAAEGSAALTSVGTAFDIAREMLTDEDGATRRDWRLAGVNRSVSELILEEMVVPVGQQAAACGTWSRLREAIVAGDGLNGVLGVTVSLGGPQSIPDDAVANKSMLTYVVTASMLTLAGVGVAWIALRFFAAS